MLLSVPMFSVYKNVLTREGGRGALDEVAFSRLCWLFNRVTSMGSQIFGFLG